MVVCAPSPGFGTRESSQVLSSAMANYDELTSVFGSHPAYLMTVSELPDSKMIPRRSSTILLQPVKKEMLFVTRILAFFASDPLSPVT